MSFPSSSLKRDVIRILFWSVATPTLSIWALISMIPIFALIGAWTDLNAAPGAARLLMEVVFAASGVLGVFGLYVGIGPLTTPAGREKLSAAGRKAAAPLTIYAAVWLGAYWMIGSIL